MLFESMWIGRAVSDQIDKNYTNLTASRAAESAKKAKTDISFAKVEIEKLLMITEALWILMRENHGYTDDDLIEVVREIDMRDGKLDGKVEKRAPAKCPECGRTLLSRHPRCLYCGATVEKNLFER